MRWHPTSSSLAPQSSGPAAPGSALPVGRRKSALVAKTLPDREPRGIIDVQDIDGDLASARLSDQKSTAPTEVTVPDLPSRMEQRHDSALQQSRQIRSLGSIAFRAREAKVLRLIAATMLPGNDVLDMEREEVKVVLMDSAVFAAPTSPPPNERSRAKADHQLPEDSANSCRAFDLSNATNVPKAT